MTHLFQTLADNLKAVQPGPSHPWPDYDQWVLCVRAVADACQAHDSEFDRAQFLKACQC